MVNSYFNSVQLIAQEILLSYKTNIMILIEFANKYFKIISCFIFIFLINPTIYGQLFKDQYSGVFQGTHKNTSYRVDAYKSDKKLKESKYISDLKENGFTNLGYFLEGSKILSAYYTNLKDIKSHPIIVMDESNLNVQTTSNLSYFIEGDYLTMYLYISYLDPKINSGDAFNHFAMGLDLNNDYAPDAGIYSYVEKNGLFDSTLEYYKMLRGKYTSDNNNFITSYKNHGGLLELKIHLPTLFKDRVPTDLLSINLAFPYAKNSNKKFGINPFSGNINEKSSRVSRDMNALHSEFTYLHLLIGEGIEIKLPKKYGDYDISEEFLKSLENTTFFKQKKVVKDIIKNANDKERTIESILFNGNNFKIGNTTADDFNAYIKSLDDPDIKNYNSFGCYPIHYSRNPHTVEHMIIEMLNNSEISVKLLEKWIAYTYHRDPYYTIKSIEYNDKTSINHDASKPEIIDRLNSNLGFLIRFSQLMISFPCRNIKFLDKENKVVKRTDFNLGAPTMYFDSEKLNFSGNCSYDINDFSEWNKFFLHLFNIGFEPDAKINKSMSLKETKVAIELLSNDRMESFGDLISAIFDDLELGSSPSNYSSLDNLAKDGCVLKEIKLKINADNNHSGIYDVIINYKENDIKLFLIKYNKAGQITFDFTDRNISKWPFVTCHVYLGAFDYQVLKVTGERGTFNCKTYEDAEKKCFEILMEEIKRFY